VANKRSADAVTCHQQRPARQPIGERTQRNGADNGGQERQGVHRGGCEPGVGAVEHEHGQRDPGDLVAQQRLDVSQPQQPELALP